MPLFIRYDEKMDALPVRAQLTAVRGSMILQMERNNILNFIQKTLEFSDQIDALKTVQEKRALCGRRAKSIRQNPETICVTYPGHIDWGALSSYMKMAHLQCTVLGSPLFVTITTLKDDFWFCFIQRDETEVYARTFIDLLRENGIFAELEECFREDAVEGQVP